MHPAVTCSVNDNILVIFLRLQLERALEATAGLVKKLKVCNVSLR